MSMSLWGEQQPAMHSKLSMLSLHRSFELQPASCGFQLAARGPGTAVILLTLTRCYALPPSYALQEHV